MNDAVKSESRWESIVARDRAANGRFYIGVKTTGVYCRPSRPARRPRRENAAKVLSACRFIENAEQEPRLDQLALRAGLSPHHFHRVFKSITGLTPKQYAAPMNRMRADFVFGTHARERRIMLQQRSHGVRYPIRLRLFGLALFPLIAAAESPFPLRMASGETGLARYREAGANVVALGPGGGLTQLAAYAEVAPAALPSGHPLRVEIERRRAELRARTIRSASPLRRKSSGRSTAPSTARCYGSFRRSLMWRCARARIIRTCSTAMCVSRLRRRGTRRRSALHPRAGRQRRIHLAFRRRLGRSSSEERSLGAPEHLRHFSLVAESRFIPAPPCRRVGYEGIRSESRPACGGYAHALGRLRAGLQLHRTLRPPP